MSKYILNLQKGQRLSGKLRLKIIKFVHFSRVFDSAKDALEKVFPKDDPVLSRRREYLWINLYQSVVFGAKIITCK